MNPNEFDRSEQVQIKGVEIALRVGQLLSNKIPLEDVLYQVVKENLQLLPVHLRDDPREISTILHGAMFYANNFSGTHLGYKTHDSVLRRLLPLAKTERFIQSLFE